MKNYRYVQFLFNIVLAMGAIDFSVACVPSDGEDVASTSPFIALPRDVQGLIVGRLSSIQTERKVKGKIVAAQMSDGQALRSISRAHRNVFPVSITSTQKAMDLHNAPETLKHFHFLSLVVSSFPRTRSPATGAVAVTLTGQLVVLGNEASLSVACLQIAKHPGLETLLVVDDMIQIDTGAGAGAVVAPVRNSVQTLIAGGRTFPIKSLRALWRQELASKGYMPTNSEGVQLSADEREGFGRILAPFVFNEKGSTILQYIFEGRDNNELCLIIAELKDMPSVMARDFLTFLNEKRIIHGCKDGGELSRVLAKLKGLSHDMFMSCIDFVTGMGVTGNSLPARICDLKPSTLQERWSKFLHEQGITPKIIQANASAALSIICAPMISHTEGRSAVSSLLKMECFEINAPKIIEVLSTLSAEKARIRLMFLYRAELLTPRKIIPSRYTMSLPDGTMPKEMPVYAGSLVGLLQECKGLDNDELSKRFHINVFI